MQSLSFVLPVFGCFHSKYWSLGYKQTQCPMNSTPTSPILKYLKKAFGVVLSMSKVLLQPKPEAFQVALFLYSTLFTNPRRSPKHFFSYVASKALFHAFFAVIGTSTIL